MNILLIMLLAVVSLSTNAAGVSLSEMLTRCSVWATLSGDNDKHLLFSSALDLSLAPSDVRSYNIGYARGLVLGQHPNDHTLYANAFYKAHCVKLEPLATQLVKRSSI